MLNTRNGFWALALCGFLSASATAQVQPSSDDLLKRTEALKEIAAQKLKAEVQTALTEARRLQATSPTQALARLKGALLQLDQDVFLPSQTRRTLTRQLENAIAAVQRGVRVTPERVAPSVDRSGEKKIALKAAEKEAKERARLEAQEIEKAVDSITKFNNDGRFVEAERLASDISRRFPNNPAAQAMTRQLDMASRVRAAQELLAEQEKRIDLAMRDVQESALPPIGEIEFPKDWKERTKDRKKVHLTEKEQQILKALEQPVTLNYTGEPFGDVIQALSDALGETILLDKAALAQLDINSSTPVTAKLKNVSARTALRKILQDQGLTYIIQNEVIQVTSPQRASETLVTRVYYLGDLIRGPATFNPFLDQAIAAQNAQLIVDSIKSSVDPLGWQGQGGLGTIRFHFPTMSLIVRQTAEVHSVLDGKFAR